MGIKTGLLTRGKQWAGRQFRRVPRRAWSLAGLLAFLGLFALGVAYPLLLSPPELSPGAVRWSGYLALLAMALPYLHIVLRRTLLRHRRSVRLIRLPLGSQAFWLRAHVIASWLAFLFALIHSGGRAGTWLTGSVLALLWAVMLSGAAWYWGQRLVYRVVSLAATPEHPEYGRERLATRERLRLRRRAARLMSDEYWKLTEYDVKEKDWPALCRSALDPASPFHRALWKKWLTGKTASYFDAVRALRQGARPAAGEPAPGQMNPVIGALNEIIEEPKCDLIADLRQDLTGSGGADPRVGALVARAEACPAEARGLRNRIVLEAICPQVTECAEPGPLLDRFYREHVEPCLGRERVPWVWLFTPAAHEMIPHNVVVRFRALVGPCEGRALDQLLRWVERRRQLNREEYLDRLATLWLRLHGLAAAALLVLALDHVLGSLRFGGF
ncbi:MAG TPA: hypothetical protein VFW33_03715 [Gemmataceae bacterium]|nr:hypothetical protein [Gemmataceae bacterium]